jgi:integrase
MSLTDTAARSAKLRDKPYKIADERGLYLLVNSAGKYWRFDYRFGGRRKTIAFGVYPDVTVVKARERRNEARRQVAEGIDPGLLRKAKRESAAEGSRNSFEVIAREWHARHAPHWTSSHGGRILRRLEVDVFPWVGGRPITEISAPVLLTVLRRIESRGAIETAHRALQNCSQVFRYAVATGRAERDPCGDLRGALPPVKQKHHASITDPKQVGELLRAISGYQGSFVSKCALRLAPLVFVRPVELRQAEWTELDLDSVEWRIPSERMKMRALHVVPLSKQAVKILRELHLVTGRGRYIFPAPVRRTAR